MPAGSEFGSIMPFARGHTFRNSIAANVESALEATALGKEYMVEDDRHGTTRHIRLKAFKNSSGATMAPRRVACWSTVAGERMLVCRSLCAAVAGVCAGVVDDYMLTVGNDDGVIDDDVGYLVVGGPVDVILGDIASNIAVGDRIVTDDDAATGYVGEAASAAVYAANPVGIADETADTDEDVFRIIAAFNEA